MEKGFLSGAIRRHESINALKDRAQEPLPSFIQNVSKIKEESVLQPQVTPQETNISTISTLQHSLENLEQQKQEHLRVPPQKHGGFMRLSSLGIIILLLLMAGIFFLGGYLFSYTHLPGGKGITNAQYQPPEPPNWRQQPEVITGTGALQEAPTGPSYLDRRAYLQSSEAQAEQAFQSGKERSKIAAQAQAKQILNSTLQNITTSVRKVAGDRVANIFDPFSRAVVGGTVGQAISDDGEEPKAITQPQTPSQRIQSPPAPSPSLQQPSPSEKATTLQTQQPNEALQKGTEPTLPPESAAVPPSQPPPALFALEVQTFQDGTDAYSLMRNLQSQGYSASYIVRTYEHGQLLFKVRIGNFASYTDANRARSVLETPSRVVIVGREENRLTH